MTKTRIPAVENLFEIGEDGPRLLGERGRARPGYFFPRRLACADPLGADEEHEPVLLSNRGKVWSYSSMEVPPPEPYAAIETFEPFVLAAVELEAESLVVLGQMVAGTPLESMSVGMDVELFVETLYEDDDHEYLMWKWKPSPTERSD